MSLWIAAVGAGLLAAGAAGAWGDPQSAPATPPPRSAGTGQDEGGTSSGTARPSEPALGGPREGRSHPLDRTSVRTIPTPILGHRIYRTVRLGNVLGSSFPGPSPRTPGGGASGRPEPGPPSPYRSGGTAGRWGAGTSLWTPLPISPGSPGRTGGGRPIPPLFGGRPAIQNPSWPADGMTHPPGRFLLSGSEIRMRPSGIDGRALGPRYLPVGSATLSGTEIRPKH
jgi:hypothetical protein